MQIIRHLSYCPRNAQQAVVALGNFDGIHRGHQHILNETRRKASALGTRSAVLTFEPHPVNILQPRTTVPRLTPFSHKARLLAEYGIDILFCQRFDRDFSRLSAEDFVQNILIKTLKVSHIITGNEFIFGHRRSGNSALLQEMGKHYGFGVSSLTPIQQQGEKCGSRTVRQLLQQGNAAAARTMLGRPWEIIGRVQQGKQQARLLGFPTANLMLKGYLRPRYGVYIALAQAEGSADWHPSIANIGIKPTFGGRTEMLELHMLNQTMHLYGKKLRVQLLEFLREERKFQSLDALQQQIRQDVSRAASYHKLDVS